jgi:predicted DNA binding CopG/RHH family protein
MTWTQGKSGTISLGEQRENKMSKTPVNMPKFKNESEEADWWASADGRAYVQKKTKEARAAGTRFSGSPLVARLNKKSSTQIALRLPGADIEEARKIAGRKGIGYQTLLKMIVHEGLRRESRRG